MNEAAAASLRGDASIRRIAVFRALHWGDLLCATPALRAVRAAWPHAHITLVSLPWARAFAAERSDLVDGFAAYPVEPDPADAARGGTMAHAFAEAMRARRFDLAIQLHGSGATSNAIVSAWGARIAAGFYPPGAAAPSRHYCAWPSTGHEVVRLLTLTAHLGADPVPARPSLPITRADRAEADALLEAAGLRGRPVVVVHAGARLASRRWPVERFAAVAQRLARDGFAIVTTGTAAEAPLARTVIDAVDRVNGPRGHVDACGRTSLGGFAALVDRARLLLTNDTGASHVAWARGTRSVVVSSGGDVSRWAPLDREAHRVLAVAIACRPCRYDVCPIGHPCATAITVDDVVDAARVQLAHDLRTAAAHEC